MTVICEHYVFGIPIVAETDLVTVVPLIEANRHSNRLAILKMSEPLVSPPVVIAIRTASQALADLSSVVGFFREAVARREAGPRIVPVPIHKLTG